MTWPASTDIRWDMETEDRWNVTPEQRWGEVEFMAGITGSGVTVDDDYTMNNDDFCVRVDADLKTITLPAASGGPQIVMVVATDVGFTVTIETAGADLLDFGPGAATGVTLVAASDGVSSWTTLVSS